jgi:hypothetical protein
MNEDLHSLVAHLRSRGIQVQRVTYCPKCLENAGVHVAMSFRDLPSGPHFLCVRCGCRVEVENP